MRQASGSVSRQRGWIGLIVLLLALVIVAMLARTAVSQYGLLSGDPGPERTYERNAVSPAAVAPFEPSSSPPAPTAPMERARAVEGMLQQQAREQAQRIDGAAR